jgi:hypothetical protein
LSAAHAVSKGCDLLETTLRHRLCVAGIVLSPDLRAISVATLGVVFIIRFVVVEVPLEPACG